jgi:hypothetical protein
VAVLSLEADPAAVPDTSGNAYVEVYQEKGYLPDDEPEQK